MNTFEQLHEKTRFFAYRCKIKGAVTAQLISVFAFATRIVYFLLLFKPEILIFLPISKTVKAGLCQTWSEIPKVLFSHIAAHFFPYIQSQVHANIRKHVRVIRTPLYSILYSKTGVCRGIPIFLIFAPKHRLWILTIYVLSKNKKNIKIFQLQIFNF